MQTVYKIRHKPTGLFYISDSGGFGTEFDHQGEIFHIKPNDIVKNRKTLNINEYFVNKYNIEFNEDELFGFSIEFKKEDWEIVEYDLVERGNNDN